MARSRTPNSFLRISKSIRVLMREKTAAAAQPVRMAGRTFLSVTAPLLPAEITGNHGGGQKKQQIDTPCGGLGHFQHQRQPQDQQTSAADPQSGEKSQHGADDQRDRQAF